MRSSLLLVAALAACSPSISTVKTNPSPHPLRSRPAATVEIFTTMIPARPYVEVAVFTASKGKAEDHIDALRSHAGDFGCDALVLTRMPSETVSSSSTMVSKPGEVGGMSSTSSVGSSSATCVVWTGDAVPASGAPSATPAAY